MRQIAVIGGGASGMMAALTAAENGCQVTLLEKNEKTGKKIYITGKGRCNVTNDCEAEDFFPRVISGRRFLYSSFYGFTNRDMQEFLEKEGLPLKTERGNRVFPASDRASDVIRTLNDAMKKRGVRVHLKAEVKDLLPSGKEGEDPKWTVLYRENGLNKELRADAVILATGGLSYPSTGSTGDGYRFARSLGHTVTGLRPALVPMVAKEDWVPSLQGLSLKNVNVSVRRGKKKLFEEFGEMLFTHFGVSGPAILSASSVCAKELEKGPLELEIDLKPALTEEQLDARILRDFEAYHRRQFQNALDSLLPSSLIPVMVQVSGIKPEKEVNSITKEERQCLIRCLKAFSLTLTGLRSFEEAIITQGGVEVKEIYPATMESRLHPGLYFAGELLDADACTGGYNLQIAWSTGRAAGKAAAGA